MLGCSAPPGPETAKKEIANPSPAATAANVSLNPAPAVQSSPAPTAGGNVSVAPAVADRERKAAPSVNAPKPSIGSGGNDFSLFAQVRSALVADQELANAVIIEVKEGNVTLTGSVSSEAQKAKAGQLVQGIAGVKSVKNNLRVVS